MRRDALRTTQTQDGGKDAVWQLVRNSPRILRVQFPRESFTAHRVPSRTLLPDAQPGTILFRIWSTHDSYFPCTTISGTCCATTTGPPSVRGGSPEPVGT